MRCPRDCSSVPMLQVDSWSKRLLIFVKRLVFVLVFFFTNKITYHGYIVISISYCLTDHLLHYRHAQQMLINGKKTVAY